MKKQKMLVLLLIFAMALSLLPQSALAAKKKVKLNKKTVTVNVGKTVKIKLQNNKKKVKWTVTSGKKNVALSKKKKTGVTIKGMKAGKAKVQAKVGKKKYVCKVTVKNKTNKSSVATQKPTRKPVQTPAPTGKTSSQPTQTPEAKAVELLTQYNDAIVAKTSTALSERNLSFYTLGQFGKIRVKLSDGTNKELHNNNNIQESSYSRFSITGVDTTAAGDYNATLSYTEGAWSNTNTVSKQIKISVAEEKTNEQYSYISNGEIAEVNAVYSTDKSVRIPDTIDGAQVINDYCDVYDNPANKQIRNNQITAITLSKYLRYIPQETNSFLDIDYGLDSSYSWSSLKEISISDENENFSSEKGVWFDKDKTVLVKYPCAKADTEYQIPDTVKEVRGGALRNVIHGFRKIYIPASVESFPCFSDSYGTSNLSEIEVDGQNKNYKSQDGVLYSKDMKQLLLYPFVKQDVSYSVPEGVDYIKDIIDVQHLKNIVLPKSLYRIYGYIQVENVYIDQTYDWYQSQQNAYHYHWVLERIIWNNTTIYVRDSQLRDYFMKENAEQLEKYHTTISEVYNW